MVCFLGLMKNGELSGGHLKIQDCTDNFNTVSYLLQYSELLANLAP